MKTHSLKELGKCLREVYKFKTDRGYQHTDLMNQKGGFGYICVYNEDLHPSY